MFVILDPLYEFDELLVQLLRPITDSEQIHDSIGQQLESCCCQRRYPVERIADGKYKVSIKYMAGRI